MGARAREARERAGRRNYRLTRRSQRRRKSSKRAGRLFSRGAIGGQWHHVKVAEGMELSSRTTASEWKHAEAWLRLAGRDE
jgi:hypothetical protein